MDAGRGPDLGGGAEDEFGCAAATPEDAWSLIHAGLDMLSEQGLAVGTSKEAADLVHNAERAGSRLDALRVDVLDAVDRSGVFRDDSHGSAKVFVRHLANLSDTEAARRAKALRAVRDLPAVRDLWRSGRLGTCQVRRLTKTHGNRRVRRQLIASESRLVEWALAEKYFEFDCRLSDWERFVDEDGARDRNQANHEKRDASIIQDFDGGHQITGKCGSLQGAQLLEIFRKFIEAEFETDWEKARLEYGDLATKDHLQRSDAQRRFDALFEIFLRAASTVPSDSTAGVVLDVVMDDETFQRELARLEGQDVPERGADDLDDAFERYRCSTLDGAPIEPTEAVAAGLAGHARRVVVDAAGVVLDMGRTRRLFTGPAAVAARIASTTCYWPGCHVPVSACQIDHLDPFCRGGPTDQANAGPACGRHNRFKEQCGFRVWRDPTGRWIVQRPDGTQVE